jgi:pilus assembly protein CpaB
VVENRTIKGQPVVAAILAPEGAAAGLQALVPRGMRAITIEVNEFSGVAGLLTPGCRVDVIATIQAEGGTCRPDHRSKREGGRRSGSGLCCPLRPKTASPPRVSRMEIVRAITVLAKLKEAERSSWRAPAVARACVLRSNRDEDVVTSAGITIRELRGPRPQDSGAPPPSSWRRCPSPRPSRATPRSLPSLTPGRAMTSPSAWSRYYRAGAESAVTLDLDRTNTAEAATPADEVFKNAR